GFAIEVFKSAPFGFAIIGTEDGPSWSVCSVLQLLPARYSYARTQDQSAAQFFKVFKPSRHETLHGIKAYSKAHAKSCYCCFRGKRQSLEDNLALATSIYHDAHISPFSQT